MFKFLFSSPKEKTIKLILEKKPSLLMHTSPIKPKNMYGLKPVLNKNTNQSYVFATDDEKLALLYTLQPFVSFKFGNNEYGAIITGTNHNLLKIDNIESYIYKIDSKNFNPNVLENGNFNNEWLSNQDEFVRKDIEPKKVKFSDVLRSGIQVFWLNNIETLIQIDKEMNYNGLTTGSQKFEFLKEQTNWKPDKVMYVNQYRNICPAIKTDTGYIVDYNKQVGN